VVDRLNDFFVNVGPKLAKDIKHTGIKYSVMDQVDRNPHSFFLGTVEGKEIIEIVSKCTNKTSNDCDDIDMSLVKKVIDGSVAPLTYIYNLSFKTGVFPEKMKVAKVIPLYKTGDSHVFNNYRPISLLSQFSKILEKLFTKRLDNFIDENNLLMDSQYGFRSGISTSMALIELVDRLTNCIENKKYAVGIFIDLKKAFDTVDHEIMLTKIERYGIRGVAYNWIKNYLDNRSQFVQMGNHRTVSLSISCGVPQGSVLGPKLFILYLNYIFKVSNVLKFTVFVDDTNVLCCGDNLQQMMEMATFEMEKLKLWFDSNKLSLNLNKTKFMVFGNRNINIDVRLVIDNQILERVYDCKFLGVVLDHKLCWKPHIKNVCMKMARIIGILSKTRYILNKNTLHTMYCTLILPYMLYCVEVWGNTYKSNLLKLRN